MKEDIQFLEKINDDYLYSLNVSEGNVSLRFKNSKVSFHSYLIFKNGYPNEEVVGYAFATNLDFATIYVKANSEWIEQLKVINCNHPSHMDKMFDFLKHYIISFPDETFECIADFYEITSTL